jgi:hypothetical protein
LKWAARIGVHGGRAALGVIMNLASLFLGIKPDSAKSWQYCFVNCSGKISVFKIKIFRENSLL